MVHGYKMPLSLFSRKNSLSRSLSSSSSTDSASSCGILRIAITKRKSVAIMVTTDERTEVGPPPALMEDEPCFTFESSDMLARDMCQLAFMPELCDVTFLVGRDRKPICAVKSVLAARSPVFREMLFGSSLKRKVKSKRYKPSNSTTEFLDYHGQTTVVVDEFDFDIFKRVLEYAHTGYITIQARTLLGLVNAAHHFDMPDLVEACMSFLCDSISPDNVCSMLSHAEKYTRYFQTDSARLAMRKILEFVDQNAEEVLGLRCLSTVPKQVMMLVLDRDESSAGESVKFEAALRWCKMHHFNHPNIPLKTIFEPFARLIEFHRVPASDLMQKVKKSGVVEERVIVNALAYQADPSSVDPSSINSRAHRALSCGNYKVGQDSSLDRNRSTSLTNLGHRVDLGAIREDSASNLSQVSQYSQSHGAIDAVVHRVDVGYSSFGMSASSFPEPRSASQNTYRSNGDEFESGSEIDGVWPGIYPQPMRIESPLPPIMTPSNTTSARLGGSRYAPLARAQLPSPTVSTVEPPPPLQRTYSDQTSTSVKQGYLLLSKPRRYTAIASSKESLSKDYRGSVGALSQVSSSEC